GKKAPEVEMNIEVLETSQVETTEDVNDAIDDEAFKKAELALAPPRVVKRKKKHLPMLTMEEAAMRMDLSDDKFMAYRSEEDQKLKVIYQRRDNTLGILEIE